METIKERPTKRELIVEEASRIFYQRGTAVGVDTLIDEIGVAKMTLYKHFPTKPDLIVACLKYVSQRYIQRLQSYIDTEMAPQERILAIFDSLREWFEAPNFRGCAFVNAAIELADETHPARAAVLEHKRAAKEWLKALVEDYGVSDSELVTRQIAQLMEGAIATALMEHDPTAADVAKVTAQQILMSARRTQRDRERA